MAGLGWNFGLVVVRQVYVEHAGTLDAEHDPPGSVHTHGPLALASSLQRMQPEGGSSQVTTQRVVLVKRLEYALDT